MSLLWSILRGGATIGDGVYWKYFTGTDSATTSGLVRAANGDVVLSLRFFSLDSS
jgi:hypothetical protein